MTDTTITKPESDEKPPCTICGATNHTNGFHDSVIDPVQPAGFHDSSIESDPAGFHDSAIEK
jgi:hypothetical protein